MMSILLTEFKCEKCSHTVINQPSFYVFCRRVSVLVGPPLFLSPCFCGHQSCLAFRLSICVSHIHAFRESVCSDNHHHFFLNLSSHSPHCALFLLLFVPSCHSLLLTQLQKKLEKRGTVIATSGLWGK